MQRLQKWTAMFSIVLAVVLLITASNYRKLQSSIDNQFNSICTRIVSGLALDADKLIRDYSEDWQLFYRERNSFVYTASELFKYSSAKDDESIKLILSMLTEIFKSEDMLRTLMKNKLASELERVSFDRKSISDKDASEYRQYIRDELEEFVIANGGF